MPATWAASTSIRISPCPSRAGGWSFVPEAAFRDTAYTISQIPIFRLHARHPHHQPRSARSHRSRGLRRHPAARHRARFHARRTGIANCATSSSPNSPTATWAASARRPSNVLLIDTTDIATDTNEAGYSLTQRFYLRAHRRAALRAPRTPHASARRLPGRRSRASGPVGRSRRSSSSIPTLAARSSPAAATSSTPRWT